MAVSSLNRSQVLILKTLSENPDGLTKPELIGLCDGASVNAFTLGPTNEESLDNPNYESSLYARGLVKPYQREGEETVWKSLAAGRKSAEKVKTRLPVVQSQKIPPKVLDRVVKQVHPTKTYSFEEYTSEDCQDVRSKLPPEWHHVDDEALKQQMKNRRKQGAYSQKKDKVRLAVERCLRDFGENGNVAPGTLTDEVVARLNDLLESGN